MTAIRGFIFLSLLFSAACAPGEANIDGGEAIFDALTQTVADVEAGIAATYENDLN